jgi:phosphomannomutase
MEIKFPEGVDSATRDNVLLWLGEGYDLESQRAVREMMQNDPKALIDAFYCNLSFGTAGMRGLMGPGTNRMNSYTVGAATQGFANYLLTQPAPSEGHSIVIGYDSRHHSREFAEESAKVLVANGIQVYLFKELRPVPLVSFACRHLHASGGIIITASHNPPAYNGYKIYWSYGGQVVAPHDAGIAREAALITRPSQVKQGSLDSPLVHWIGEEIDQAYLKATRTLQVEPGQNRLEGPELKVVYSSLHGAGITIVPRALDDWGFTNFSIVEEQREPDGDFPTVKVPNPEEHEALALGIEQMEREGADLLIATDPDTDRIGIALRHQDKTVLVNGNEFISICLDYLCERLDQGEGIPDGAAFIKTIVTTELFSAIAESYGRPCFNVLTGFKYIGEMMEEWETTPGGYLYLYGGEESYGSLLGRHARDKDAVVAAQFICEVALHEKLAGRTLIDRLHSIYRKYGVYRERLESLSLTGKEGQEKIERMLRHLREQPPRTIGGVAIAVVEDYLTSERFEVSTSTHSHLTLPKSNVLLYLLEDGSKLIVRPSGTEPKVKFYCSALLQTHGDVEEGIAACDKRAAELIALLKEVALVTPV